VGAVVLGGYSCRIKKKNEKEKTSVMKGETK
jgi:hypothetical protein